MTTYAGNPPISPPVLAATGKGFVKHGSDPNVARPKGYASIEWFGSVEPKNAINGDTWIEA